MVIEFAYLPVSINYLINTRSGICKFMRIINCVPLVVFFYYVPFQDPSTWTGDDIVTWLRWSEKHLRIDPIDAALLPSSGSILCTWSVQDFSRAVGKESGPLLAASLFWLKRPHHSTG